MIDALFDLACIAFGVWFGVMVGIQAVRSGSGDTRDLR